MSDEVQKRFDITGMHCPSCSMLVKMSLVDLDGVISAEVDHRSGVAEVAYDPDKLDDDAIIAEIIKAGYDATAISD